MKSILKTSLIFIFFFPDLTEMVIITNIKRTNNINPMINIELIIKAENFVCRSIIL